MKYLIVTADDLGLTKSINEGISRACREGIVKSVSVIPTGEAFDDAVDIIKELGLEHIGAHLALTETKPVLNSSKYYKNHNKFFLDLLIGRIKPEDIYNELKAQLDILRGTGIDISYINSHEHIHIVPEVMNIFLRLAREYGIKAIRYPRGDRPPRISSPADVYKSSVLSFFAGKTKDMVEKSGLLYTDYFLGLLDAGRLREDAIVNMLNNLKDGVTELVCHPGFLSPDVLDRYSWHKWAERELFALTDKKIKNVIHSNNINLITYREFIDIKQ